MAKKKTLKKLNNAGGNEQTPDSGGDPVGSAVGGGFEPLLGWATTLGAGGAAIVYMKSRMTTEPQYKPTNKGWKDVNEQGHYYAALAEGMEHTAKRMNHPSYYRDQTIVPFNERDIMFNKIGQIKLTNDAARMNSRAKFLLRQDPDFGYESAWAKFSREITDPFKKPRK